MDARTLSDVISDFQLNPGIKQKLLERIDQLITSTTHADIKKLCNSLNKILQSTDSPESIILSLIEKIENLNESKQSAKLNDPAYIHDIEEINKLLTEELDIARGKTQANTALQEARRRLSFAFVSSANSIPTDSRILVSSLLSIDSVSDLLASDTFKDAFLKSEIYQLIRIFIQTLINSQNANASTPSIKPARACYWEKFIFLFNSTDPNQFETLYKTLKQFYSKRETEMEKRSTSTKTENKETIDVRHPVIAILESSKIDEKQLMEIKSLNETESMSCFILMSGFVRFLNTFLTEKKLADFCIAQQFQYALPSEKQKARVRSPIQQFQQDIDIMKQSLIHPKNPTHLLTQKRTAILKRIFLLLQSCKQSFIKPVGAPDYVSLLQANLTQPNSSLMPVAALLGHGGRITLEIPAIADNNEDPQRLLTWLIGGSSEVNKSLSIYNHRDAAEAHCVVYNRRIATHSLEHYYDTKTQTWHVCEISPNSITDISTFASDVFHGRHFGFELNFMRADEAGIANGTYGHAYFYFLEPTLEKPGGLLIGFEGSAYGFTSYYGAEHTTKATSNAFSSTGGTKISPDKHRVENNPFDGFPLRPEKLGGIVFILTPQELDALTSRTANDFHPDQLSHPAGEFLLSTHHENHEQKTTPKKSTPKKIIQRANSISDFSPSKQSKRTLIRTASDENRFGENVPSYFNSETTKRNETLKAPARPKTPAPNLPNKTPNILSTSDTTHTKTHSALPSSHLWTTPHKPAQPRMKLGLMTSTTNSNSSFSQSFEQGSGQRFFTKPIKSEFSSITSDNFYLNSTAWKSICDFVNFSENTLAIELLKSIENKIKQADSQWISNASKNLEKWDIKAISDISESNLDENIFSILIHAYNQNPEKKTQLISLLSEFFMEFSEAKSIRNGNG